MKEIKVHVDEEPLLATWFVNKLNPSYNDFKWLLIGNRLTKKLESEIVYDLSNIYVEEETIIFNDEGEQKEDKEERTSRRSVTDRAPGLQTVEQAYNAASEWDVANKAKVRKFHTTQVQQKQAFAKMHESKSSGKDEHKRDTVPVNQKKQKRNHRIRIIYRQKNSRPQGKLQRLSI